ncbi:MAG: aminotransferase class V-fold PLP-dependent enzyme [Oscillospiraceae bacterium]|nr:aminotransferase class V-fold PLP-dependent enzyme [Oscillospiraceae bacterium]
MGGKGRWRPLIYLDNSATSLPRPPQVIRAVTNAMEHCASPGRGSGIPAEDAAEMIYRLRMEAGRLFHTEPEQVVFTTSATHGLNIAIKSIVGRKGRVVCSGMEHNAVIRPLRAIGADVQIARGRLFDREALLRDFDRLLTPGTALCVMTHVSNVFGWILPVEEVAELCRRRKIPFVLDASQSAGILPVDMSRLGAAFVACPGHKGLLGPQGTGLLICNHDTKTLIEGGTGSLSKGADMPDFLPDRLEPGTPNVPGAAGLLAGIRCVRKRGEKNILRHEVYLRQMAQRGLRQIPGVHVFCGEEQTGVLSLVSDKIDCVELGEKLARQWDIATRSGIHCAFTAHETAGTLSTGTLRISPGYYNTEADIMELIQAVEQLHRPV